MMTKKELEHYERLNTVFLENVGRVKGIIHKCARYKDAIAVFSSDYEVQGDNITGETTIDDYEIGTRTWSCRFPSVYLTMTDEELNAEVERIIKEEREEAERQKKEQKESIKNKDFRSLKAILERHPEWKGKTVEEI